MNAGFKIIILFFILILHYLSGNTQQVTYDWKHVISGNTYTALNCMATDSTGNMYVGGRLDSTITFVDTTVYNPWVTGFLAKFTPNGQMVWFKQIMYSGTVYSICFDSENKLYISGSFYGKVIINDSVFYTHDSDTTFFGMFMAKFDTDGNLIWAKTTAGTYYYESGYAKLKQMTIDKDNNIVLVGTCINEIQFFDTTITYTKTLDSAWVTDPYPHWSYFYARTNYLAKFNKDGQNLWIKDCGMQNQHYLSIATDYSNNILITGYFWDDHTFCLDTICLQASGGENLFIAKYSPNGQVLWAQRAGGAINSGNRGFDVIADSLDNIYVTGVINGGAIEFGGNVLLSGCGHHLFLTKYDSTGIVKWFKHYGTDNNASTYDYGLGLTIKNNNIYLCGFFLDSLNLGFTVLNAIIPPYVACGLIFKFDYNGNLLNAVMDQEDKYFYPIYLYLDNSNNLYVAGNLLGSDDEPIIFGKIPSFYLNNVPENIFSSNNIIIAPNPCNNYFYLITDEKMPLLLEIYDITGKPVVSHLIRNNLSSVDVSGLSKGIYLIKINNEIKKLLVN